MYFPVTSRCSDAGGSGAGSFQASGIRALIESRFCWAFVCQSIVEISRYDTMVYRYSRGLLKNECKKW